MLTLYAKKQMPKTKCKLLYAKKHMPKINVNMIYPIYQHTEKVMKHKKTKEKS